MIIYYPSYIHTNNSPRYLCFVSEHNNFRYLNAVFLIFYLSDEFKDNKKIMVCSLLCVYVFCKLLQVHYKLYYYIYYHVK